MTFPGLIKAGSTDTVSVKAIKKRLNELTGSTLGEDNGNFGPSTEAVVKQFQKSRNLISDGVVGELTWERLMTVIIPHAIDSPILRIRAEQIMFSQLHVRELTGKNDGKEVEEYLKSVGLGKGYPYCQAFMFWGFQLASNQLLVPNLMPKTAGVLDCYRKAKKYVVTGDPQRGDQGIMDFGKGTGHTFMVTSFKNDRVFTIEGNTSADPAYAGEDREGNGIFERNRPLKSAIAYLRYE